MVIPGFFQFIYTENPGIAFGQLQEGGAFGRWFFVVLAVLAAIAVFYYFLRTPRNDDRVLGACALLLAGIVGNLTDRVRSRLRRRFHRPARGRVSLAHVQRRGREYHDRSFVASLRSNF